MNILAQAFQIVIDGIYGFTGDYGVAIVAVTLMIRFLLVPLNLRQRSQMAKQQEISKQAEEIRTKYRKNEKKQTEELQKLYQEQGTGMGGCLLSFLQLPIMLCLYQAIRMTAAVGTATVLLPWVSSLLVRDQTLLLPVATLIIQVLPQTYPYFRLFRDLKLQKTSLSMVLTMLLANSFFVFVIPSGVGLYYLVSGLFAAGEQFLCNFLAVRRMERTAA